MYYCENCRTKNNWPGAFNFSHGQCECCGVSARCHDRPSSSLPRVERATEAVNPASVRATTASAAPTIDDPSSDDESFYHAALMYRTAVLDASERYAELVAVADKFASARAEEARREGFAAGLVKGYDDGMKETQELCKTDSQRTAGGDAEYLRLLTLVENCIARHNNGLQYFEDVRAAATEVAVQPVAEAAAQANDAKCEYCGDPWAESGGCPNFMHCRPAAAPTAQPTPRITGCVAREAPSPYVALGTAQPTLPDDRAIRDNTFSGVGVFVAGNMKFTVNHDASAPHLTPDDAEIVEAMRPHLFEADGGYACDTRPECVAAAGRAAAAALRQPGVLPDEADKPVDCRKIGGDVAVIISQDTAVHALNAMREKYNAGGYDNLFADDRSFVVHGMYELEAAANAKRAAKQAGKEA